MNHVLNFHFFTDLLLSNQETGGHPVLPEGSKADIVETLKHLLADQDYLRNYLDFLATSARRFGPDRQRHVEFLPSDRLKELLAGGPEMLNDSELATLLLSPLALSVAQDALLEGILEGGDLGPCWFDALAAAGKRAAQHANVRPDLEALFKPWCFFPQVEDAPLVGSYLGSADASAVRTWTWTVDPAACRWLKGDPAVVTGEEAIVKARWEDGKLSLIAKEGGFLWYGVGFRLHVLWASKSGGQVEGTLENQDHAAWLQLTPPWGSPSGTGDRLEVTHAWNDPESGWEIHFELEFSDRSAASGGEPP